MSHNDLGETALDVAKKLHGWDSKVVVELGDAGFCSRLDTADSIYPNAADLNFCAPFGVLTFGEQERRDKKLGKAKTTVAALQSDAIKERKEGKKAARKEAKARMARVAEKHAAVQLEKGAASQKQALAAWGSGRAKLSNGQKVTPSSALLVEEMRAGLKRDAKREASVRRRAGYPPAAPAAAAARARAPGAGAGSRPHL